MVVLNENGAAPAPAHQRGGLLDRDILVAGKDVAVHQTGDRYIEHMHGFIFGKNPAGKDFRIRPVQHAFTESIRKIVGKGRAALAQAHEMVFRQGVEIGFLLDPQGSDGNAVVQQHGDAPVAVPFAEVAFEAFLAPLFVVKLRGAFADDVEIVDTRPPLDEQHGSRIVVNEGQVADHVVKVGLGQEGKRYDTAEEIAGLAGDQNRAVGFIAFALLEGIREILPKLGMRFTEGQEAFGRYGIKDGVVFDLGSAHGHAGIHEDRYAAEGFSGHHSGPEGFLPVPLVVEFDSALADIEDLADLGFGLFRHELAAGGLDLRRPFGQFIEDIRRKEPKRLGPGIELPSVFENGATGWFFVHAVTPMPAGPAANRPGGASIAEAGEIGFF